MEKRFLRFSAAVICVLALLCCSVFAESAKPSLAIDTSAAVTRSADEIVVFKGTSAKLAGTLENVENAKKIKLTWESSDESVAPVKQGTVSGKNEGKAVITCKAVLEDGTELTASVNVSVEIGVKSLTMKDKTRTVYAGYVLMPVELKISPDNATCQTVTWSSEDESVATVDPDGTIKGVKAGKTKIIAVSNEPVGAKQKAKQAAVTVEVLEPSMEQAAVAWDLKNGEMVASRTGISGLKEDVPVTHGITDLEIRDAGDGKTEMAFIYHATVEYRPESDEQIEAIVKGAKNGGIGAEFGYCIVDYTTGMDLEEKNEYEVVCTAEVLNDGQVKHTAGNGAWITLNENVAIKVTATWPTGYEDFCIGVIGHSTVFADKNDTGFWEGKVPFHKTAYYFKDHPEYTHFVRVRELLEAAR